MPKVTSELSDLFFNQDHEKSKKPDHLGGGYDPDLLVEEADDFLESIKAVVQCSAGNPALLPVADDLAEDFLDRL